MSRDAIHFPENMRWSCHNSGRCCHSFDIIGATDEEAQRIEALDTSAIDPKFQGNPPLRNEREGPNRIMRIENGACCLLGKDNLCSLHKTFGPEVKPAVCHQFPFLFTETPGGVYAGLSFLCPSVVAGKGKAVEEYETWAHEFMPRAVVSTPAAESIRLSEGVPVEWEDYLLIESQLLAILHRSDWSLEDRLIAGSVWLGMLELFLREAQSRTNKTTGETIAIFAGMIERDNFERILRIARLRAHKPIIQRMFLGMFIALRNAMSGTPTAYGAASRVAWNYVRHGLRFGRIRMGPTADAPSFSYRDFRETAFVAGADFVEAHMERYLAHMIFRKELLKYGEVISGYHYLLMAYALTRWFAVGLAANRKLPTVGEAELSEAISMVERFYVAHAKYLEFFQKYPVMGGIFYSLTRRKNFAHSMVRSPV